MLENLPGTTVYAYNEEPLVVEKQEPKEVRVEVIYSKEGIERLIRETFVENPDLAVAVAKAESGENLNPNAFNPEWHDGCQGSYGVFQLACLHTNDSDKLFDVEYNIKKAHELYLREGWKPWGGYTSGGYKKFL